MIFFVAGVANPVAIAAAIDKHYASAHFLVADGQWLVVDSGTSQEVADKLGVISGENGAALIVGVSGYSGRQVANLWEWMKSKMQAAPNG